MATKGQRGQLTAEALSAARGGKEVDDHRQAREPKRNGEEGRGPNRNAARELSGTWERDERPVKSSPYP